MVNAGVHSFFRMSRQIAPVYELILGCHIFVSNFICNKHCSLSPSALPRVIAAEMSTASVEDRVDQKGTYFGRLEWVVRGNRDVYYKGTSLVASVRLSRSKAISLVFERDETAKAGTDRERELTGPKMVPFQCLRSSPTRFAWTVF